MHKNILSAKRLFVSLFVFAAFVWVGGAYANGGVTDIAVTTPAQPSADAAIITEEGGVPQNWLNEYVVGPDDEIQMRVFGEDDLSGMYVVSTAGELSLPLIGNIHVQGLNLPQIKTLIVSKLKDGYLLDPQVSLEVKKYRPFYILGEVNVPGSYDYVSNMSVLNAVALAGGYTYRANKNKIEIRRKHNDETQIFESRPEEFSVIPGDVILVKERFF